jgi:hypothetical protein
MAWQAYRWIWRLESPLHVGLAPAGFLNRTRLYIPARTMWGALTAALARQTASGAQPDYAGTGEKLRKQARFSYLYPAERTGDGQWLAWIPRYEEGQGLYWQREDGKCRLSVWQLRRRLLSTYPATAIDPVSHTAAEGTLREVEYVLPRWRDTATPVAFVGYVFLQNDIDPYGLKYGLKELDQVWIGGEVRYGFGRLRLLQLNGDDSWQPAEDCFSISLDPQGDDPILQDPQFVYAHTMAEGEPVKCGAWEMVLGWNQDELDYSTCADSCWAPGSRAKDNVRLCVTESGLWKKA